MKIIYRMIILALLICNVGMLGAQHLKIVRTDVDTLRSGFVTAKYLFGIDVIGDSIFKCSAVSFSLRWTNEAYIKFSGWRPGTFGDSSATYVSSESGSGNGTLYVGITAAEPFKSEGYDNPYFIHFDFAVLSSAVNNSNSVFNFITLRANVNTDSGRVDIVLEAEPVSYNIHSFIDVWPGDTDNNGIVNNDDILPIDLYFDFGSEVKKSRTFKRDNSSAIWKSQRVLAWDEFDATFADCDGNGVVNEADVLVLGVNAGLKKSTESIKMKDSPQGQTAGNDIIQLDNNMLIPVHYSQTDNISGMSGIINFDSFDDNINIIGIQKSEAFMSNDFVFLGKLKPGLKNAHFALVSINESRFPEKSGVLCYLVADKAVDRAALPTPYLSNVNVIDSWGYISPYSPSTSVNDGNANQYTIVQAHGNLKITCAGASSIPVGYSLCDLMGRTIITGNNDNSGSEINISLDGLAVGSYMLVITKTDSCCTYPFIYNGNF